MLKKNATWLRAKEFFCFLEAYCFTCFPIPSQVRTRAFSRAANTKNTFNPWRGHTIRVERNLLRTQSISNRASWLNIDTSVAIIATGVVQAIRAQAEEAMRFVDNCKGCANWLDAEADDSYLLTLNILVPLGFQDLGNAFSCSAVCTSYGIHCSKQTSEETELCTK